MTCVSAGVPPDAAETREEGGGREGGAEVLRVRTPCRMSDFIVFFVFFPVGV